MAFHSELPIPNLFLASVPQDQFDRLRPHFERLDLPSRTILYEMGEPIDYCTFTDGGMTSLLIRLEDGALVETGVIGREGIVGLPALMGSEQASHSAVVQMPGLGIRIKASIMRDATLGSPGILNQMLRYSHALSVQIAQTAACNAHHDLQERLARWLLMAHDRAEGDALPLTQEFISIMLAVRRPGVTVAARSLQATGAIDYQRGRVIVLDRLRLEEASCECYGIVSREYERLLGWHGKK